MWHGLLARLVCHEPCQGFCQAIALWGLCFCVDFCRFGTSKGFPRLPCSVAGKQQRLCRMVSASLVIRDFSLRSASVLIECKIPTPRKFGHFRHPSTYDVSHDTLECFEVVFVTRPEQWRSEMDLATVPKNSRAQGFVFRNAIIDVHSQTSKHDAD